MTIDEKLGIIQEGISQLQATDLTYHLFGAERHKYRFNKPLTETQIVAFENRFGIRLPEGYRRFSLEIGNGGAGPYYGLETLHNSLYIDLDYKREGELQNLSEPFELIKAWNLTYQGEWTNINGVQRFEEHYFDEKWSNGLLRICNHGCGASLNLVVNGVEYGNMWVDNRGSDGGIYPDPYFGQTSRTLFLDWYILWLKDSFKKIGDKR